MRIPSAFDAVLDEIIPTERASGLFMFRIVTEINPSKILEPTHACASGLYRDAAQPHEAF